MEHSARTIQNYARYTALSCLAFHFCVERVPRPVTCQYTRKGLLKVYRALQSTTGLSDLPPGFPLDPDVTLETPGTPLALLPMTAEEEDVILQTPECANIRKPKSGPDSLPSTKPGVEGKQPVTSGAQPAIPRPTGDTVENLVDSERHVAPQAQPETPKPQGPPVRTALKPRAPYNPFARVAPQASATPTGQSRPEAEPVLPRGPEDLLRLLTSGVSTKPQISDAGPSAQRSLEPEPSELPSILSMLLPAEEAKARKSVPRNPKPFTPPMRPVYSSEGHASSTKGAESSHVAASDWAGTSTTGPSAWGEPDAMPDHIKAAFQRHREQTKKGKPSPAARKAAMDNLREDVACCICFENPKNAALVPCGHRLCFDCSNLIHDRRGDCPLCNKRIESVLKLFN